MWKHGFQNLDLEICVAEIGDVLSKSTLEQTHTYIYINMYITFFGGGRGGRAERGGAFFGQQATRISLKRPTSSFIVERGAQLPQACILTLLVRYRGVQCSAVVVVVVSMLMLLEGSVLGRASLGSEGQQFLSWHLFKELMSVGPLYFFLEKNVHFSPCEKKTRFRLAAFFFGVIV